MKNYVLLGLSLFIGSLCFGQTTRQLSSFDELTVHEGIEVILTKGTDESARIEADGIAVDKVLTDVSGGTLKVHLEGNNNRGADVRVYITYVSLEGLSASSAGSISADERIATDDEFEISCSSAGSIEAKIEADEIELDVSSSGDVTLEVVASFLEAEVSSAGSIKVSGKAASVEAYASSSGEFNGYDLEAKSAEVKASSGGSVKVNVSDELDARASSGGSVRFKGNPSTIDKETSSGGSVRES
ncbi:head GIN domain-containing protein [Marinoscillum furvescens]|uniref:Putative autotransporter adhesin-like protein n=1 Tax=Marinoscillum furvescens DSM 4134 TaxID=1122208 RepID=A0A3D9KXN6_MARFU|nr:head GIN domain-containing protein [Marinoscillum furvescens]RED93836.1 putative autotransporter adhesin-like protein [Marinoscillum furvescens DSM 4134]